MKLLISHRPRVIVRARGETRLRRTSISERFSAVQVYVLSTGSRSAARSFCAHDLNQLVAGPEALRFVSLFDDSIDVWNDEDLRLAGQLSEVARWSQPDEFAEILHAS